MRLVAILLLFLAGCVLQRPLELSQAESELLDVAADAEVVKRSPIILEQAAKAYHAAERTWRETGSSKESVPLARLAREMIADARAKAGQTPQARAALSTDPLVIERRTGLADFTVESNAGESKVATQNDKFSLNRITRQDLEKMVGAEEKPASAESLETDLFFVAGQSALSMNGQIALIPISDYLSANTDKRVVVEVLTHDPAPENEDLLLAQKQAESIRNYFLSKGIAPLRVEAYGINGTSQENGKIRFKYYNSPLP